MLKKKNNKIFAIFNLWKNKKTDSDQLTPAQAYEIQTKNYNEAKQNTLQNCTPPFVNIASDLMNKKEQIFQAAVFYLCQIATIHPKYTDEISDIFTAYINSPNQDPDRIDFIQIQCHKSHLKIKDI